MKKNNIDTLMEQALKSNEVPPPALVSRVKSMSMSARPGPRVRRRFITALAAAALCVMFAVGAAAMTNLFGIRDLLLPETALPAPDTATSLDTTAAPTPPTVPVDDVPIQLISLQGIAGTPEHSAAAAWHEFIGRYDPDGTLIAEADAAWVAYTFGDSDFIPAEFNVPSAYLAYGAYTMEMVEKIHEIAARYNLTLLGEDTEFFPHLNNLDGSINQWLFFNPGYRFESGTFSIDGLMGNIPFQLRVSAKGVFDNVLMNIGDYADYCEWVYVNEHGNQLLLLQSERGSLIFYDGEDAFITMNILVGTEGNVYDILLTPFGRNDLEDTASFIDFGRLWADSFAAFEPPSEPESASSAADFPLTEPDEYTKEAAMAQMAGNWVFHQGNPDNAALMNISADGTWVRPGPLPTDHTSGGTYEIGQIENHIFIIRFTVEHDTSPYAELGHTFDYIFDTENDRLGMTLYSGEGSWLEWFWRE